MATGAPVAVAGKRQLGNRQRSLARRGGGRPSRRIPADLRWQRRGGARNAPPATYSAVVSGVGAASGIAMVEVYEVPVRGSRARVGKNSCACLFAGTPFFCQLLIFRKRPLSATSPGGGQGLCASGASVPRRAQGRSRRRSAVAKAMADEAESPPYRIRHCLERVGPTGGWVRIGLRVARLPDLFPRAIG